MDKINICNEKLRNYGEEIKMFLWRILYMDEEIGYISDESGYF